MIDKKLYLLISIVICFTACYALPIRKLPPLTKKLSDYSLGDVRIKGCVITGNRGKRSCDLELRLLADHLTGSGLFRKVHLEETVDSDYEIELLSRKMYTMGMGHNPALALLSLAIPFWESREYGYDFSLRNLRTNERTRINNISKATEVMWGGATFLNFFSGWGISNSYKKNESLHLRNSITNAVTLEP